MTKLKNGPRPLRENLIYKAKRGHIYDTSKEGKKTIVTALPARVLITSWTAGCATKPAMFTPAITSLPSRFM